MKHQDLTDQNDVNLWDQIEAWVPDELRASYRQVINHLKTFRKSEEILRIFEATGVLGVIIRGAPAAMAVERRLLNTLLGVAHQTRLAADADHLRNLKRLEELNEHHAKLCELAASRVQQALKSAANDIDLERLAKEVQVKLYDELIEPTQQSVFAAQALIAYLGDVASKQHLALLEGERQRQNAKTWRGLAIAGACLLGMVVLGGLAQGIWYEQRLGENVNMAVDRAGFNALSAKTLDGTGRSVLVEHDEDRYQLILPRARKAWVSETGNGVIEFDP